MERNVIVAVFFLFTIFADVSNASLLSKLRKLIIVAPSQSNFSIQVSPSPSPDSVQIDTKKSNRTSVPDNSSTVDSKASNTRGSVGPFSQNQRTGDGADGEKSRETKKKHDDETELEVGENCTGISRRCTDQNSLVACILKFESGSKKLVILVQNEGEGLLNVDLTAPNPVDNALLEIPKHQTKKLNLSLGNGTEATLRAGNGKCVLHIDPSVSQGNFFFHLPSYDTLITPINGAYFLILTVVIFGGTWVCCMFRKRRRQGGIPYQELEMGLAESTFANNAEAVEGWDQDWDDNWDEENAVKSPAARHAGSISANGLSSRSANKDGWENNWDD